MRIYSFSSSSISGIALLTSCDVFKAALMFSFFFFAAASAAAATLVSQVYLIMNRDVLREDETRRLSTGGRRGSSPVVSA